MLDNKVLRSDDSTRGSVRSRAAHRSRELQKSDIRQQRILDAKKNRATYVLGHLLVGKDLSSSHSVAELRVRVFGTVLVVLRSDSGDVLPGRAVLLAVLLGAVSENLGRCVQDRRQWCACGARGAGADRKDRVRCRRFCAMVSERYEVQRPERELTRS